MVYYCFTHINSIVHVCVDVLDFQSYPWETVAVTPPESPLWRCWIQRLFKIRLSVFIYAWSATETAQTKNKQLPEVSTVNIFQGSNFSGTYSLNSTQFKQNNIFCSQVSSNLSPPRMIPILTNQSTPAARPLFDAGMQPEPTPGRIEVPHAPWYLLRSPPGRVSQTPDRKIFVRRKWEDKGQGFLGLCTKNEKKTSVLDGPGPGLQMRMDCNRKKSAEKTLPIWGSLFWGKPNGEDFAIHNQPILSSIEKFANHHLCIKTSFSTKMTI